MNTNQTLRHAVYISRLDGRDFQWGTHDCMTMLFGWYDYLYNTHHLDSIKGQYHSARTALKFWRDYPMSVRQWMYLRGFEQIADGSVQEGDLRISTDKGYPSAYIYHNGAWWTAAEDDETRALTTEALVNSTTHWRHK